MTTLGLARWYVDADTLGLAHVLIRARPDVTFAGDDGTRHTARWTLPPCPVQQTGTPDTEWIPKVAAAGMAIISRDRAISRRRAEQDAILAAGAQMFAITDPGRLRVWDLLEIVMHRWRDMERLRERPGPYIFALSRTRMTEIDLIYAACISRSRPGSAQQDRQVLLIVDEPADVIAYQPDNTLRKRANVALQSILSQGRAPGVCVSRDNLGYAYESAERLGRTGATACSSPGPSFRTASMSGCIARPRDVTTEGAVDVAPPARTG